MKSLHLNLASRPYRNERPFWIAIGAMALITLFLMGMNARTAYRFFINTSHTRALIAEADHRAATERQATRQLQTQIQESNSRLLQARVAYVNAQITQRAFSWNELLDHLEDVLPRDVRLTTLSPQIEETGTQLTLNCVSKSEDGLVDLIRNMTADPHFEQPFPLNEARRPDGNQAFNLKVTYLPHAGEVSP